MATSCPLASFLIVNTCTGVLRGHAWRLIAAVGMVSLVASVSTGPATADTITGQRAKAQALANQIEQLGREEAAQSEEYDNAVLGTQSTASQVQAAQRSAAAAEADMSRVRGLLQAEAISSYIYGGTFAVVASRAQSAANVLDGGVLRGEYVKSLAGSQSDALDAFRQAAAQEREAQARLQLAQTQQARALAAVDAARRSTMTAEQQLIGTLRNVRGNLAALVAQAQAQAEAQTARAVTQAISNPAINIPVGRGAAAAIAAARAVIGDPYVWGAAGPRAFDCSGLTMWAWEHAGVSLPHFSGAQYADTMHVPISSVQPGDLVYPWNPGQHVAMYIGGGLIIEAPHSGASVHIVPMYSWFHLASRP